MHKKIILKAYLNCPKSKYINLKKKERENVNWKVNDLWKKYEGRKQLKSR